MNTVAIANTPESLKLLNPAWRLVGDVFPVVLPHPYYENDHSEPVQAVVEQEGKVFVSPMTWCYSFRKHGWLAADLFDGLNPSTYLQYGKVLAWSPMQALR